MARKKITDEQLQEELNAGMKNVDIARKYGISDRVIRIRKAFGESVYSYAHVGHLHHQKIVESRNMIVEQHRTLAAKDAYASRGGWMSGRSANVITYSAEYGEVARLTISPEMLG